MKFDHNFQMKEVIFGQNAPKTTYCGGNRCNERALLGQKTTIESSFESTSVSKGASTPLKTGNLTTMKLSTHLNSGKPSTTTNVSIFNTSMYKTFFTIMHKKLLVVLLISCFPFLQHLLVLVLFQWDLNA